MKFLAFLFPFIASAVLVFSKFILFTVTLGIMEYQVATWDNGQHEKEESISYSVPETDSVLTIYAKRSNPVQPEFDRRLEIRTNGMLSEKAEITGDTSGANIVDLFVKREDSNLHLYLTSPRYYEQEKRFEPDSVGPYPYVGDELSTYSIRRFEQFQKDNPGEQIDPVQMARDFPVEKFWVLYDGTVPLSKAGAKSHFQDLTRLGNFDTRYMKWVPASLSSDSEK